MIPAVEAKLSGALERGHHVRAFHGAGWVVTASWGRSDVLRVIGPSGDHRELTTSGLVSVDVAANGDLVILESDPKAAPGDDPIMRIRFARPDGTSSSISAHVLPSLRFNSEYGGAVAFGPAGTVWVTGCDISKEEGIWVGLVDAGSGLLMASVELPDQYPGDVWLYRGPSTQTILVYVGAGQHGQWQYLVEFVDGGLAWQQLGSADETTPATFVPGGTEFVAAEDWSAARLIVGRTEDGGLVASEPLPADCQPCGVFAVSAEFIIVADADSNLGLFDRNPLRFRSTIQLAYDLCGHTIFDGGCFVSEVTIEAERHWMTWRLAA